MQLTPRLCQVKALEKAVYLLNTEAPIDQKLMPKPPRGGGIKLAAHEMVHHSPEQVRCIVGTTK